MLSIDTVAETGRARVGVTVVCLERAGDVGVGLDLAVNVAYPPRSMPPPPVAGPCLPYITDSAAFISTVMKPVVDTAARLRSLFVYHRNY